MVDAIGSNIGKASVLAPAKVARVESAPAVPAPGGQPATAVPTTTVARQMSVQPPVDAERVRRIKAAVENGEFPISPAKIADRLIALKYEWMSNDQA